MPTRTIQTKSGQTLRSHEIPIEAGKTLVETANGKLLKEYSNDLCEYYYYLLDDQRVLHIPISLEAYIYEPYDAFIAHMEETHIGKKISDAPRLMLQKHLANGVVVLYERLQSVEITLLLAEARPLGNSKHCYLLPEGQVLVNFIYCGYLYATQADFEAAAGFNKAGMALESRRHRGEFAGIVERNLCGINPFGQAFPDQVDGLAAQLPGLLNVPVAVCDFTWNNLLELDWYLYKNVVTPAFRAQVFLPLLAYLGKTYILAKGGQWEMLFNEACQDWLPDIRQADGELKMLYHPVSIILNPEEGAGNYFALRSAFSHIASHPMDF